MLNPSPWLLAIATVACLAPFINKAFHIDDPLFLWAAAQIRSNPFDFYNFDVNWYGITQPMHEVTKNPPLACYYLALASCVVGYSEIALHLAMMPIAVAAVLGSHAVAVRCGARGATWLVIAAPVFVISATSVMCDVMLLALWCWAVVLWMDGIERKSMRRLMAAGLLIAAAALTKYFGIALFPLLGAYAIMRCGRDVRWLLAMILPVAILIGYQVWTYNMYGRGLLSDAMGYSITGAAAGDEWFARRAAVALGFLGGCLLFPLVAAAWLWRSRGWLALIVVGIIAALLLISKINTLAAVHLGVFVATAGVMLALVVLEVRSRNDATAWLLALWVIGTAVFAGYINWSINGRSILPLTPAAAILVVRALQRSVPAPRQAIAMASMVAVSLTIAMLATWGDAEFADASRRVPAKLMAAHRERAATVWFQGHWGFQWYMQKQGAKPLDFVKSPVKPSDLVVVPYENTNVRYFNEGTVKEGWSLIEPLHAPASTMVPRQYSGFHSDRIGALPYAIGSAAPLGFDTVRLGGK